MEYCVITDQNMGWDLFPEIVQPSKVGVSQWHRQTDIQTDVHGG